MYIRLMLIALFFVILQSCSVKRPLVRVKMWEGENEKSGVLDADGDVVIEVGRYQINRTTAIGVAAVEVQGLEGLIDEDGSWIIEPQAEGTRIYTSPELDRIGGPFYELENTGEQDSSCEIWSLKTRKRLNKVELSSCYEIADLFAVRPVESGGLVGFMNTDWDMEIPAQFERGGYFVDGLAKVEVTEAYAEALCASDAPLTNEHIRATCKDEIDDNPYGSGYINRNGEIISRFDYHRASSFSDGRALVSRYNGSGIFLYGYVDETGAEVIPPQFEWAGDFSEGYAVVDLGEHEFSRGIIDENGEFLVSGICNADPFSEGLAHVTFNCMSEDSYRDGYINTKGDVVLEGFGDGPFLAGHAWIYDTDAKNYGLIDKNGNWALPYRLTEKPERYSDGLSQFSIPRNKETGEWKYREGWINPEGKIIWPPGWNDPCHKNDVIVWPAGSCEE